MFRRRVAVANLDDRGHVDPILATADALVGEAASKGARLVVLPEHLQFVGSESPRVAFERRRSTPAVADQGHARRRTTRSLLSQVGRSPRTALAVVLLASLGLRMFWLSMPDNTLIFDESYYVNAARVMLGWEVPAGSPYAGSPAGLDPNSEHPPLGKAFIALSMENLGDNGNGWRIPSVIAGMVALGALYLVVRSAGGTRWLGVLATGLLAFDNLTFVHSRLGTLDMMVVAFLLLGSWLVLSGRRLAGGAMVGFATLVKLTGVFGLVSLVAYEMVMATRGSTKVEGSRSSTIRAVGAVVSGFLVVWIVGMWTLDLRFTAYTSPLDHLVHMVSYGVSLTNAGGTSNAASIASAPWQWLFNEGQINYLRVDLTTMTGGGRPSLSSPLSSPFSFCFSSASSTSAVSSTSTMR
jgi:4-amino-4-deoxy-L-arabinose transferase-like glycosyltransferase